MTEVLERRDVVKLAEVSRSLLDEAENLMFLVDMETDPYLQKRLFDVAQRLAKQGNVMVGLTSKLAS
ncbi:hypothetical protein [Niveispirillum sp. KHB5.9]|uniref:hypothetical protein n=1 Tax=Niveispirillum sp. KHB5.9 TaxID=3400269 RepID=UPI003A8BEE1C